MKNNNRITLNFSQQVAKNLRSLEAGAMSNFVDSILRVHFGMPSIEEEKIKALKKLVKERK